MIKSYIQQNKKLIMLRWNYKTQSVQGYRNVYITKTQREAHFNDVIMFLVRL